MIYLSFPVQVCSALVTRSCLVRMLQRVVEAEQEALALGRLQAEAVAEQQDAWDDHTRIVSQAASSSSAPPVAPGELHDFVCAAPTTAPLTPTTQRERKGLINRKLGGQGSLSPPTVPNSPPMLPHSPPMLPPGAPATPPMVPNSPPTGPTTPPASTALRLSDYGRTATTPTKGDKRLGYMVRNRPLTFTPTTGAPSSAAPMLPTSPLLLPNSPPTGPTTPPTVLLGKPLPVGLLPLPAGQVLEQVEHTLPQQAAPRLSRIRWYGDGVKQDSTGGIDSPPQTPPFGPRSGGPEGGVCGDPTVPETPPKEREKRLNNPFPCCTPESATHAAASESITWRTSQNVTVFEADSIKNVLGRAPCCTSGTCVEGYIVSSTPAGIGIDVGGTHDELGEEDHADVVVDESEAEVNSQEQDESEAEVNSDQSDVLSGGRRSRTADSPDSSPRRRRLSPSRDGAREESPRRRRRLMSDDDDGDSPTSSHPSSRQPTCEDFGEQAMAPPAAPRNAVVPAGLRSSEQQAHSPFAVLPPVPDAVPRTFLSCRNTEQLWLPF